jgi:ADP-ribose pyrophosphatase
MTEPVHSETVHQGRLLTVEVLTFDDSTGRRVQREVVRHPGAVVILPLLDADRIVMIRNYRIAIGDRLWELPAGTREPNESPSDTAVRELEEETGYRPRAVRKLGSFYTTPGFCDELIHLFVASELVQVGQQLDAGEDIETIVLQRDDVLAMVADGRIRDGKTIAALLMWDRGLGTPG